MTGLRISRRSFVAGLALSPALLLACGSAGHATSHAEAPPDALPPRPDAPPTPQPAAPPFVVAAGTQQRAMMAGTPYETPLYVFGSGAPGKVVMALGGEEGNEPGGWLAGAQLVDLFSNTLTPRAGAVLVLPRANKLASQMFVRTTAEIGDLNRLYPGDANGLPMAQLAAQIVGVLGEFHVDVLVDMHESWAFYADRGTNGTAYLGQTITASPADPGDALGRAVVDAENARVQADWERFTYRVWGAPTDNPNLPSQTPVETFGARGTNSLNLSRWLPGLTTLLVEMGQQQSMDRRVALHVEVFQEVARQLGVLA